MAQYKHASYSHGADGNFYLHLAVIVNAEFNSKLSRARVLGL